MSDKDVIDLGMNPVIQMICGNLQKFNMRVKGLLPSWGRLKARLILGGYAIVGRHC